MPSGKVSKTYQSSLAFQQHKITMSKTTGKVRKEIETLKDN